VNKLDCGRSVITRTFNYITFALWHEPSVCLSVVFLSSVMLLRPSQRIELFGYIIAPPNSLGTRTLCIKLNIDKKIKGFQVIVQD